jgi:hypothetical protein
LASIETCAVKGRMFAVTKTIESVCSDYAECSNHPFVLRNPEDKQLLSCVVTEEATTR